MIRENVLGKYGCVQSWPGRAEKRHEELQSGYSVSQPTSKICTSRTQAIRVTAHLVLFSAFMKIKK